MNSKNTKQKILDVALFLFSQYGFTSVSIRDICKEVKIKESSIYYHFKNKRAIFNEIQNQYQTLSENMMSQLEIALNDDSDLISNNLFQYISDIYFEDYLMNPYCNQFIRVMNIEQCNDVEIQNLYNQWMIDRPLQFQSQVFEKIGKMGGGETVDYEYMAIKYYSPIYLYFNKYLVNGELTEEKKQAFRISVNKHLQSFINSRG